MGQAATDLMTTADLLQLPDDEGIERELIRGELREWPIVTKRNRKHSSVMATITYLLERWCREQTQFAGEVQCGEAGFRLTQDPDSAVGIDVAVVASEHLSNTAELDPFVNGPPLLAVEILSPSDTHERVNEKIGEYLRCGVALVWIVDPDFRTVTVHSHDDEPLMFNVSQKLIAEPHLPGFAVSVSEIFS